jgi:hypothetical protein
MPEASQLEESYRKSIANLDIQRKSLETEADAIYLELTTPPGDGIPPMGVDDPLVDRDGYPRGDIDIYRARTLRQRYHIVQTDHKELMKQTEELLYKLAALKVRATASNISTWHFDFIIANLVTINMYFLESKQAQRGAGRIRKTQGGQTQTQIRSSK